MTRPGRPRDIDWRAVRAAARERFGVERFRRGQRELVEAALLGRDAIGVLPTGAGKSLCFQLPGRLLPGTTVVVSPLIALMKDQTEKLDGAGFPAARLDSTLGAREARRVRDARRLGGVPRRLRAPPRERPPPARRHRPLRADRPLPRAGHPRLVRRGARRALRPVRLLPGPDRHPPGDPRAGG